MGDVVTLYRRLSLAARKLESAMQYYVNYEKLVKAQEMVHS